MINDYKTTLKQCLEKYYNKAKNYFWDEELLRNSLTENN